MGRTPESVIQALEAEAQAAPEIADDFDVGVDEQVRISPGLPTLSNL